MRIGDSRMPSCEQAGLLKKELNALLWTDDPPQIPEHLKDSALPGSEFDATAKNVQCAAHLAVTTIFFMRRGFAVTTRRGMAFVVEMAQGGSPKDATLNQIVRHFWITLKDHGLVDFSLHAEKENPLVFCNQNPAG